MSNKKNYNKNLARILRRNQTWAEKKLWLHLRNRKLCGKKFRRQQPLGPYILDFYCAEEKLNIEIDGGQHDFPEKQKHDIKRGFYLEKEGLKTLRFWNSQIRENIEGVLAKIRMEIGSEPSPAPSP